MTEIEDLQAPHEPLLAPLCIKVCIFSLNRSSSLSTILLFHLVFVSNQDPRDYFYSQQANALKTLGDSAIGGRSVNRHVSTGDAYCSMRESISDIKSVGLQTSIIKAEVAFKVCLL